MKKGFNIFRKKLVARCGHPTFVTDYVTAFGVSHKVRLPIVGGKTNFCHFCLEKMAIRCARCGEVIFVWDPVTIYSANKNSIISKFSVAFSVAYDKEQNSFVSCCRGECADTYEDAIGFWCPPGQVILRANPLKLGYHGDTTVFVGGLRYPKETVHA